MESTKSATHRFEEELKAFLATSLNMQEPAVSKVTDLTVGEFKRSIERSNLDDLNDIARDLLFKGSAQ